jgi:hypothetical protein
MAIPLARKTARELRHSGLSVEVLLSLESACMPPLQMEHLIKSHFVGRCSSNVGMDSFPLIPPSRLSKREAAARRIKT